MKKIIIHLFFLTLVLAFVTPSLKAKDKEYEALVKHLQKTFQAKKVKIPFMWLARFAVRIVKPAGQKATTIII